MRIMDLKQINPINFKIRNCDIIMPTTGKVLLKLKSGMSFHGSIWLHHPEYKHILNVSRSNIGQTYDIGDFAAHTRLVFALITLDGSNHHADGVICHDDCDHIEKLQLDANKWEVRWESGPVPKEQEFSGTALNIEVVDALSYPANKTSEQRQDALKIFDAPTGSMHSMARNKQAPIKAPSDLDTSASISSSASGKTTDSYVAVLSWNCLNYSKKTLILACTNFSNDLNYRIRGYARSGSSYYSEIWAETTLAHGDTQPFFVEGFYNVITVEVKSASAGKASSFVLDYCGL